MNWIDGLLGFAVLTGPLWLILIIVPVALWITFVITKRMEPGRRRSAARIGLFVVFFLLPFGDEIAGRAYLGYLCATKAGVKVYQTVELPAKHWDDDGTPKFYNEINGRYYLSRDYPLKLDIQKLSQLFHMDKQIITLVDHNARITYSENVTYRYWGGWVRRNLSPHNVATSCGNFSGQHRQFIKKSFKPLRIN